MTLRVWWMAIRPATLLLAVAPVAVGAALAARAGGVRWGAAAAALVGAMLLQVGTNLANDLADFRRGADGAGRLGPTRVTQAGLVAPRTLAWATAAAFALATLAGVYLTAVAGWPVVAMGVAAILVGLAYTDGPWPLGYHGLGEAAVLLFFGGVAVVGTAFVAARGPLPATPLLLGASLPVGALAAAVLVVNQLRDRAGDAGAGKRTLAVRLGRGGAVIEYALLVAVAYVAPALLVATGAARAWALLPLVTAPLALRLVRRVATRDGAALNPLLAATARLTVLHALLLAVGLL